MKKLTLITSLGAIACLLCTTFAQAYHAHKGTPSVIGTQNLIAAINGAVRGVNPNAHIGIVIKSMKHGDTIYMRNDKTLFVPASTLKIFTAEAALLYLGPEYKFPTRIVTDSKNMSNGKLYGNIYLINSGDPTLTSYDLVDMLLSLKSQHIQEIIGNVYIDNTAYDQVSYGPGWLWSDRHHYYGAPINASIIDHNYLSFRVAPGKSSGALAQIVDPQYSGNMIKNSVMTRSHASRTCYIKLSKAPDAILRISGCIPRGRAEQGIGSVVGDIMQYNQALLQNLLKQSGIKIAGTITAGTAPTNLPELVKHESEPLHALVKKMLKVSDNIIAGSLFKKIGALFSHRPGTWENGGTAVSQILSKNAAVDLWRINLIDGSGLSRYNQVTPAQMMQLLDFSFHHYATNRTFISSLPIAGIDGTLKRRMRNIAWRVRAKTGSMSGVVSLAGYAISDDKEPFAFVIMINGHSGSIWQYREFEDKVMMYLTHYKRG